MLALRQQVRGSPLVFPGRLPGFDPSHVAGAKVRFSAVGAWPYNLLSTAIGVIKGGAAAPTAKLDSVVGPAAKYAGNDGLNWAGQPTGDTGSVTFGAIFRKHTGSASGAYIATRNIAEGNTVGSALEMFTNGIYFRTSSYYNSLLSVTDGNAYFLACSALASVNVNFVLLNLATGVLLTGTATPGAIANSNGNYMAGISTDGNSAVASIASCMVSGAYLSMAQLKQWAADPWAFWYPRTGHGSLDNIGSVISAANSFFSRARMDAGFGQPTYRL